MLKPVQSIFLVLLCTSLTSCMYFVRSGSSQYENNPNSIFNGPNCDAPTQELAKQDEIITQAVKSIKIESGLNLKVRKGNNSNLKILGGEKDIKKVEMQNNKGTLILKIKPFSCITTPIELILTIKDNNLLNSFEGSGGSTTKVDDIIITSNNIDIQLSGASNLDITTNQNINKMNIEASGASRFNLNSQIIDTINIKASGVSNATINSKPINHAKLEASGASHITIGEIKDANLEASGASTINLKRSNITSENVSGASTIINN